MSNLDGSVYAVGFYWVYKKYSFYLWGNDFFTKHPRMTVAVDFTI